MKQYTESIKTLCGVEALGDISLVSMNEMVNYLPGSRELSTGWRETGHYARSKNIFAYKFRLPLL